MPENDIFKRYLEAGITFTQMTRAKAEDIVKEWVAAGEVQRDQAQQRVDELVDRSKKNTEQFFDVIRKEVANQLQALGLATKQDLADLEARLSKSASSAPAASTAPAASSAPSAGDTAATTEAPATKAPAKKAATAKKAAKKAAPESTPPSA